MTKTIIKEVIITLLMCVVILLILAVVFYDYNPLNKVIPNRISYATPNEVQEEIAEGNVASVLDDSYNVVYSIDNADLQKYKKSSRYVPGKEHPFTGIEPAIGDTIYGEHGPELATGGVEDKNPPIVNAVEGGTGSGTTETSNTQVVQKTNTNPDSTGTYLNTTGKK